MRFHWAVGILSLAIVGSVRADDWPQWMGPQRDGHWNESGIIERIPEQGLPVRWRTAIAGDTRDRPLLMVASLSPTSWPKMMT